MRLQPTPQRGGELARTALRHREPDGLPEHGEQHSDESGAGGVQRDVGVAGVTGEQQPGPVAAELAQLGGGRGEHAANEGHPADLGQPDGGAKPRPDRRKGGQQGIDDPVPDQLPAADQGPPGCPVAWTGGLQQIGGDLDIAVQQRPGAIRARVAEWCRGVDPAQPELLQAERPDHRGGRGHRIEGAEGVGDEVRVHLAVASYRPANLRLRLEQQHLPPGVGQPVGRDQPVVPGADDDGVDLARQRLLTHVGPKVSGRPARLGPDPRSASSTSRGAQSRRTCGSRFSAGP